MYAYTYGGFVKEYQQQVINDILQHKKSNHIWNSSKYSILTYLINFQ